MGTPYTAEVVEVHGNHYHTFCLYQHSSICLYLDEKPMPHEVRKKKSRSEFDEDSTSEEEKEEELPKKVNICSKNSLLSVA
jgi:hypothetical protein